MSTKIPLIRVKRFEKLLFYLGFESKRQKGSHASTYQTPVRFIFIYIIQLF